VGSDLHPLDTRLANGLRVIVQPEAASNTVNVFGHIRNRANVESPPGEEGIAAVVDGLFSYGTKSRDRLSFQKALDDIGASESAGTTFFLHALRSQFERGMQLLADNELRPAFTENSFRVVRNQVAGTVAGQLRSPGYLAERALETALFPKDDPVLRQATPASVSALTLADINSYYRHVFRPDLTTIVVIGNITPEDACTVVEKYFGTWTASGPPPDTLLPTAPPNKPAYTDVPDADRVQDDVKMAETVGLNRSNPDYYALALGNHVLGGSFYATRLYRDLRENTGLVYYVASTFSVGRTRGIYTASFASAPANVSRAAAIVRRNLQEMCTDPVSPSELRLAKSLVLNEIPLSDVSEDRIAAGFLGRSNEGLPLDEPLRSSHQYLALTADQVRDAFAKWIRPDRLAEVIQGPTP
jgi:zinc protease